MLKLSIPYPPTVNHYWIQTGKRKTIGAKGIAYRNEVYYAVRTKKPAEPLSGRLSVKINATMPDKRRRDLDNILKAALDGLQNAGIYLDDCQIDALEVRRGPVQKPGRLKIEISEFS